MSATQVSEQVGMRGKVLSLVEESGGNIPFAEIGRTVGISRERVRKIARAAGSLARVRGKRQELVCPQCGKMFTAVPWQIKRRRRYCSRRCAQQARQRGGRSPILVFRCESCGQPYTRKAYEVSRGRPTRFCSRECHGKWLASNFGAAKAREPVGPLK